MHRRTKIIATVGPASSSRETLRELVKAGVNVFRINFSHGDAEERTQLLGNIRDIESELDQPVAVCGDLCGPKIRVGMIAGGAMNLTAGHEVTISRAPLEGTPQRISTTLPELVDVAAPGEQILLADGRLRLEVVRSLAPAQFVCRVVVGGRLQSGKGVNLPHTHLPLSALTEKDREDVRWIAAREFDFVALSFVQRADDVIELRKLLDQGGSAAHIIAKIEKPEALSHIDTIIDAADAIMVARGDLGVEMDFPTVPLAQKAITKKCQAAGKPSIIATEMLESMIESSRPTRAEVSDVANAVFDRADAVMLSAESAIGKHPVLAVTAMRRTVAAAEVFLDQHTSPIPAGVPNRPQPAAALAASACRMRDMQPITAIAVFMATATTARLLSKNRPECPVLGLSSDPAALRRAGLYYGVIPSHMPTPASFPELLTNAVTRAKQLGIARRGDHMVIVAGYPFGAKGRTNGFVVEPVD
jgi:pyruvate kinase